MGWKIVFVTFLFFHLASMQLAGAGPLVAALFEWRGHVNRRTDLTDTARWLAWKSIVALLLGVVIGLLLAVLATYFGDRDYLPVVQRFYSRVWWGGWEIVTSLVVMLIYVAAWNRLQSSLAGRITLRVLAVFAATNLLYHFPPLMSVMVESLESLSANPTPTIPITQVTSPEFRALIFQTDILAKTLHFAFAGFAIVGATLMWQATREDAANDDMPNDEKPNNEKQLAPWSASVRYGGWLVVFAVAMQLLIGMWLVVLAPASDQARMMGGDTIAAGALVGGVLLSLSAMNQAASVGMGDREGYRPRLGAAQIGLVVFLMIVVLVW